MQSYTASRHPIIVLARLVLILALLFILPAQPEPVAATAAPTSPDAATAAIPAAELLNADGTLNTNTGASGAVNLAGWHVTLDAERGPILARAAAAPAAGSWSALGAGLNNWVYAIGVSGSDLYVGGRFTDAGGDPNADRIVKWNGSSWSALGAGLNNTVYTIAVSGSNIYVGGNFTDAGGDANADYIAKWNGASWSPLGTGLGATVRAIAVSGSDVYVGGDFTDAGGDANADMIAKWNGAAWSALGTGLGATVRAIAISGSDVYVGGSFTDAGGNASADGVAKWNGAAWSALGAGLDGEAHAIAISGSDIYVGGIFTDAGGDTNANLIAKWNGAAWSALGTGFGSMTGWVRAIAISGSDIYVGGTFADVGGDPNADRIVKWNGASWSALGAGVNGNVYAIAINGGAAYVGGIFTDAGGDANADYIAKWVEAAPTSCTSTGSGNWSDAATWSCGHVPGLGEAVTIAAGHTVTMDQDVTLDSNLDVQGTLVPNGKTVRLTGSAAQTLKGSPPNMTFYNLVVNKDNAGDVVTIEGKLKVTKKLTITKGKLKSASDYGDVEIAAAGTLELTSDVTVGGNWTNNGTFIHNNHTVTFDGTTLQTLDGLVATPFYRWVIAASAQVAVAKVPTAADSVENNGVLSQTQTVNNATVNFLQISTDKYRGVDITTPANLSSVTVAIGGNHARCTSDTIPPSGPYRNRCFRVTIGSIGSATPDMTFYTTAAEDDIASGDDLYLYNDNTFTLWAALTASCGAGAGDPCTTTAQANLQTGNNYFLIGGADPPTAVTLNFFTVSATGGEVALDWQTASEVAVVGFNVYRATSAAGPYTRVNADLIPAQGDALTGAAYHYVDTPGFGAFYYQLEDVAADGGVTRHDAVGVQVSPPHRLYLPILTR